ncbi:MAG: hybrid sensor histidine kinase/response regulator [Burkholderiaceae bacterium]
MLALLPIYSIALVLLHRALHGELVDGLLSRRAHEIDQRILREQSEKLAALLRLKEFFIAAASHDLRQPAQAVQLLARTVHDSCTDDARRHMTGSLLEAADQVTDLINRLLDLARLDLSGEQARPAWSNLRELVANLESTLLPRAQQTGVRLSLRVAADLELMADPLFLTRILQNLLVNAIDHAQASEVVLEAELPNRPDQPLALIVSDNGKGIDLETAKLIEHPTQPLSIDSRAPSVRGLGLAIAARLAHLGGLSLTVTAMPGSGTRFALRVASWRRQAVSAAMRAGERRSCPQAARSAPPVEAGDESALHVPGRRQSQTVGVLLIEDDPLVRLALRTMLHVNGMKDVVWLPGDPVPGEDENAPLRLILADWQRGDSKPQSTLPGLQQRLPRLLPVIFLSGLPELPLPLEQLADALGSVEVQMLQKPVDEAVLRRAIAAMLMASHPASSSMAR